MVSSNLTQNTRTRQFIAAIILSVSAIALSYNYLIHQSQFDALILIIGLATLLMLLVVIPALMHKF
jgi:hypothetical protein